MMKDRLDRRRMVDSVRTERFEGFELCGVEGWVEVWRDLVWSGGSEGVERREAGTGEVCLVEVGGS